MQKEIYGERDLSFSAWHRRDSIKRFIDKKDAEKLSMIDLDSAVFIEWEDQFKEPIAIIEAARDNGQYKHAWIIKRLAQKADIYGILLLYKLSKNKNPVDTRYYDIDGFKIKILHPKVDNDFIYYTPLEWAKSLVELRNFAKNKMLNSVSNGIYNTSFNVS